MKSKFFDRLTDMELTDLTRFKRLMHLSLKIAVMVGRDFIHNLVKLQAMALAFKTLLSLATLLAVIVSILKGLGVHNRMEPALAEAWRRWARKGGDYRAPDGFVDKMKRRLGG